ncbi:hypothetical protein ASD03_30985 [Ensifer sp. Root127]|nr:hypothetical protein ASD03_30985 [Ensifer sp. Root127]
MLLKKLNEGDYDAVPAELMKWVYTGGKRVKGLINLDRPRLDWGAKRVRLNQHATGRTEGSQLVTKENVSWVAGVLSMTAFAFTGTGPHQWAGDLVVAFVVGAVLFIRNWLGPA